ncbi:MAG: TetR/AcrR family transcriptional regulator [Hyphomicrobiales bacterium]
MMSDKGAQTRERILDIAEALILQKGYSGTAIDDILAGTNLTKGAFFHHFKSKNDLAFALVERFWQRDVELFRGFADKARALAEDPLQEATIWLKLFEEQVTGHSGPPISCLFASYLYERQQFDRRTITYVEDAFQEWAGMLGEIFERLVAWRAPRSPITAPELAEFAISVLEGGFVMAQAQQDTLALVRQSARFRQYLQLQFGA